jgi:hypothetical protein
LVGTMALGHSSVLFVHDCIILHVSLSVRFIYIYLFACLPPRTTHPGARDTEDV